MTKYNFKISTKKNKKYDAYLNGNYIISFGDLRYQHYFDKIGAYSHLNHHNSKRRYNYYQRFGIDSNPNTAKYFSHNYLW